MQSGAGMTVEQYRANGMMLELSESANLPPQARQLFVYKTIPEHVLLGLGYTVTATRVRVEPVVFDVPVECALLGGKVEAGLCVGTRIFAHIDTKEGVHATAKIELRVFKPGEQEHMYWEVDGLPHTRIRVERDDSAHATAANLFNRIPDIIAATPGIVPVSKLGPLRPTALS